MPTITLTPNQADPLTVLDGRGKDLDSTRWAYKFSGGYGLDVAMVDELRIDERRKSLWIPIADGNRQDDVGDVLEVGGIRADRHRLNPIVLFDHGKQVTLPIGLAEDRETKAYTFEIDPVSRTAGMEAFFYEGKGIGGVERDKEYDHAVFCDQLFDLAAKRLIRAGSIGYKVIKAEQIPADYREGKPQGLHLLSVLLLEGSLVVLPANGDTVRKMLGMPQVCGKPLSPWLVKSLTPMLTEETKTVSGYEGKAIKKREVDDAAAKYQSAMSQYGENNMTTQRAEIRYYELKQKWEDETGQKYGRIKAVEDSDIPPAKWKPGVGAVKDLRAKYGRKSMDENDTPDQARQYGSDDWRHGVQLSGNPYKRQDLRQAWESGWTEKKRTEMGEKSKTLRSKYRNVKSARRRVKSSRPGSSMIRVHGKDLEAVQQAATRTGVKFERAGNANGLEKVRLTGDDGAIDGIAKQYGRRVKGMDVSQSELVQGYVATITTKGKRSFAKFGGGLTNRFADAEVVATIEEAFALARLRSKTIWDVPGALAIDGEGRLVERKCLPAHTGSKSMTKRTKALPEEADDTEGHADEKYSAQVLKQLHKDHNTLLQSYDEMRGPLEHPEIDALVAEFLEGIVEGIEKIEAAYTKHHPDAEPLGKDLEAEDVDSGIEEEQNGDEVAAVDTDVDEEEELTPEEKRLAARRTKALRNGYGRKKSMYKLNNESAAQQRAKESGLRYGLSVIDGKWYVGTEEQLKKIGVSDVKSLKKGICPECGKEDCQCGKSLRNGKRKDMDEEVGEVRDDLEEVGEELEDVEEYGKALEPHETSAVGEAAGFLKSDVMEGTDWTEESRMKAYHYHKALDGIAQVEGLADTVGNEEVETKARDSAGGGWDNPKEQRAAAARMTEEEDWEEYPKSLEVSKQKARDSAGGGWNNRKEQRAAAARMTEEEDWEEYPKSLKGKKTKAAPGTPEWEAEEATEPEHKMHPHRKMCKDASGFLKELSASNELAEEMRTKAGDWHKQLDEIVNPPQKEEEEEVVEPGEMGQKSVQTILLEDIEADGIPISKAQSEARSMGLQVAAVPYGVEVTGEQSGLDAYLRKLGLQGNSGSYLKSLYAKRMKALINHQNKAMEELNGRLASLAL